MPSPTAAQVAAAAKIAGTAHAIFYSTEPAFEKRMSRCRNAIADALAEREAAVRAETWEAAARVVLASTSRQEGVAGILAAIREAARG